MIDPAALQKRIRRLEELPMGLARDEAMFQNVSAAIMADEQEK